MSARLKSSTSSKTGKALRWGALILALVLVIVFVAAQVAERPLRDYMEDEMNRALSGYTVTLPELDLHLPTFALTLHELTISQDAHPEPPIARFPRLHASVHWYEILFGQLVAEFELDEPQVYLNLVNLQEEDKDEVPVEERGWQKAVQAIYPLEINRLEITGGEATYIDEDADRPLTLSGLYLLANNIRNIHSPRSVYPSPLYLESVLLEEGRIVIDGKADFLAEPHLGVHARIELEGVPLTKLKTLADRTNLFISGGELSAAGHVEYAPQAKTAALETLLIQGLKLDYVHSPAVAALEEKRLGQMRQVAEQVQKKEHLRLRAHEVRITESELGFVNKYEDPDYRLFISDAQVVFSNFSDDFRQGPARARLAGRFMGSGVAGAAAVFRTAEKGSNFDLDLKILNTNLPTMNDLLRAYGNFDVVDGRFSLFSEIQVRGHSISGYIKPLFKELDIYAGGQESEEGLLKKAYEGLLGGLAELLENPQEAVATKVDLSGTVEDPEASTLQIILQLLKNAFFDTILPRFEEEAQASRKAQPDDHLAYESSCQKGESLLPRRRSSLTDDLNHAFHHLRPDIFDSRTKCGWPLQEFKPKIPGRSYIQPSFQGAIAITRHNGGLSRALTIKLGIKLL